MKPFMRSALIVLFLCLFISLRYTGLADYFSLENLAMQSDILRDYVHDHYSMSVMIYCLVYVFAVATSLPVGAPLTMVGGFLFGVPAGLIYTVVSATIGAVIVFVAVRYLIGFPLQRYYAEQLMVFNEEMRHQGWRYLLIVRLVVVFPFFLVNLLAALTSVSLVTFMWTTVVGIIPGSSVFLYAGHKLGSIETVSDVFSVPVIMVFILLALFVFLPLVYRRVYAVQN